MSAILDVPQRLLYIDALRGFAVLGVIAIHSSQYTAPFKFLNQLAQQGKYGVQLFYVVSAFTILMSLSIRTSVEPRSLRNFFIRRFFRIAPLFYCAVVFYLIRDGLGPRYWLGDAPAITSLNIFATATFANSINPYWINSVVPGGWSVAIEMVFYLTVPFLYRKIKSIETAVAFTFAALLLNLLLFYLGDRFVLISDRELWVNYLYLWLPAQMPVFGLGFILFFIYEYLQMSQPYIQSRERKSYLLAAICLFMDVALAYGGYSFLPAHFLYSITFVGLTLALMLHPFRFFVNRFTTYVGKISYSAYLTHSAVLPLVQSLVNELLPGARWYLPVSVQYIMIFIVTVLGTIIISSFTYRLIELPGQNIGRHLISRLEARDIREAA